MGSRRIEPELLDHAEPEEAKKSLADIVRLNRDFGGHGILKTLLADVVRPSDAFSLLDVGAASGDTAKLIHGLYPHATAVSLDRNATNLALAPAPRLRADAFRLPFGANSFDFVFSSLFLHHFQDSEVVDLLRSFGKIARRAVLISDLERHLISYWFLPATKWMYGWHRLTVHDGVISVRAAFTADELYTLATRAGLHVARVTTHHPAFRISLVGSCVG
jgi:2-polyprenyl-3-methyl-5-hydroxy-6-metoxy-1,4-benzoquinol methylase